MKRSYSVIAFVLVAVVVTATWHSIRANERKEDALAANAFEISDMVGLVERIEALEQRLAVLERKESLVRQVDSRETMDAIPAKVFARGTNSLANEAEIDDEETQKTNGQKWNFRLLGRRNVSASEFH